MTRLFYILVSTVFLLLITKNNNAQTISNVADNSKHDFLFVYGKTSFSSNVPLNEINTRAFRYFRKKYPEIDNEQWMWSDKGMSAFFEDSISQTRIFFDDRGNFISSAKAYTAYGMGAVLKNEMLRLFPEYKAVSVTEEFDGHRTLYWVTLSKDESIKTVEVRTENGEAFDVTPPGTKP